VSKTNTTKSECEDTEIEDILFDQLSPLLMLIVLPFRAFNDINSMELYGEFSTIVVRNGNIVGTIVDEKCIISLLINRMHHIFEFENVRKLAAEVTIVLLWPSWESDEVAKAQQYHS
jgi:hypothetical protein